MGFGSLGFSEMLVIAIIVLVFFGPRRMPEIARSLGQAMREFRRSLNEIQREFESVERDERPPSSAVPHPAVESPVVEPPVVEPPAVESPAAEPPAAKSPADERHDPSSPPAVAPE